MASTTRADGNQITKTTKKTCLQTPNTFEHKIGYFRAVRRGPMVMISGTTAARTDGQSGIQYPGDAKGQAGVAFDQAISALRDLGGDVKDVVRVRMFVKDSADCMKVCEPFTSYFRPEKDYEGTEDMVGVAATMIVVSELADPDMLFEVEMDAYVL